MTEPTPERDAAIVRIAANVRSALAFRDVRHAAAAERIGLKPAAFSRRMSGEVPFDAGDLVLLASILDLSPGHLVDGEPWPQLTRKEVTPAPVEPAA